MNQKTSVDITTFNYISSTLNIKLSYDHLRSIIKQSDILESWLPPETKEAMMPTTQKMSVKRRELIGNTRRFVVIHKTAFVLLLVNTSSNDKF